MCVAVGMQGLLCVQQQPISSGQGPWEIQLYSGLQVQYGHFKELCQFSPKSQVFPSLSLTVHSPLTVPLLFFIYPLLCQSVSVFFGKGLVVLFGGG